MARTRPLPTPRTDETLTPLPAASPRSRATLLHRAAEYYRPRSVAALRISTGLIFLCFGALKLIPSASPAEHIAVQATTKLTLGLLPPHILLPALATAEICIGLALLTGILLRYALAAFYLHMTGVFASLFLLPDAMWHHGTPTLEGQYVLKNIVLIAACLAVTADELTTR
ncbi:DoxX family membrane protein (plasmid) [Streptomyces zaomyceticus]|uniref:DoxX family membrane protein n=1 Tax=Streptomyces zaomyceticus TaxID=68286 RepID=A0ABZ1LQW7_9ACTN